MSVRLTILCENTCGSPRGTVGEHGFACFIETETGNYLLDTGQGVGLAHNAALLGKDLSSVKAVLVSHGHYDHTQGLPDLLRRTGPVDVFAHPDIFAERYTLDRHGRHFVGIPWRRAYLESLGARFRFERNYCQVAPGLYLSGEIPRLNEVEKGDLRLVVPAGDERFVPDPMRDDLSLVIHSSKGLVLVLGCAHAGVVNIMDHVCRQTGQERIYAVVGGTHLGFVGPEEFQEASRAFQEFGVERIGVSHCTGLPRAAQLYAQYTERFFFGTVGTVLEV